LRHQPRPILKSAPPAPPYYVRQPSRPPARHPRPSSQTVAAIAATSTITTIMQDFATNPDRY
ncbi:MAG: hypothetical protein K0U66_03900, partial [Gammaproteobacteria bacterium]|nr:hypothetical protein [Gammaproteobacteria bacterium]